MRCPALTSLGTCICDGSGNSEFQERRRDEISDRTCAVVVRFRSVAYVFFSSAVSGDRSSIDFRCVFRLILRPHIPQSHQRSTLSDDARLLIATPMQRWCIMMAISGCCVLWRHYPPYLSPLWLDIA